MPSASQPAWCAKDHRHRTESSATEALIVNLLLMSLFAVQHSLMARRQFKRW